MRGCRAVLMFCLVVALSGRALARSPELLPPTTPTGDSVLSLQRTVMLAMANSPIVRQAQARIDQAQGLAIQAGLYPNPHSKQR